MEGELCRTCAERLERELGESATGVFDDVMSGRVTIGDVVAGAVSGYIKRTFGSSPILRDFDQTAREVAAQARAQQARRAGSPPGSPPPSGSPRSSQRPPPPPPPRVDPIHQAVLARSLLGFQPTERLTKEMIDLRRKKLAKVFHPDVEGGSQEQMTRVNQAADLLLSLLAKKA